jgi:RNA polymerase sigma factor FliA
MRQIKEERIENGFARPALEREELIAAHIPLIKLHVSRLATQLFSTKGVDQLVDAGVIGLIEAAQSHDGSGEPDFKVHADQCIRAAISERISVLNGTGCPMPIARKSTQSSEKLRPKLKYEASDLELALGLGIDVEQLASFELIAQIAGISVGGFSEVSKTHGNVADDRLFCYDPDPCSDGPGCLVKRERILRILTQVIDELPKSERLVMALHYLEELTVKEIAMVLRVGEWRILQLHTKAMLRLRTSLIRHIGPHEQIRKRRD